MLSPTRWRFSLSRLEVEKMFKIPNLEYTAEFKELAVKCVWDWQAYVAVVTALGRLSRSCVIRKRQPRQAIST